MKFYVDALVDLPDEIVVDDEHIYRFDDDCEPPTYIDSDNNCNELLDIKDGVIRVYVHDKTYYFELDASNEPLQKTIKKAIDFAKREEKKDIAKQKKEE